MREVEAPIRTALTTAGVRRVTAGFLSLTLGEWVLGTVAAIVLYRQHGAIAVGLIGARFVPAALASLATAHLADRHHPARVLALAALARAGAAVGAAVALGSGAGLMTVTALIWLDAMAGSAYRPAQARLLPLIAASPAELAATATLCSSAKSSGQIAGALLGSLLAAVGDGTLGGSLAAALYVIAVVAAVQAGRSSGRPSPVIGVRTGHAGLRSLSAAPGARRIAAWSGARSIIRGAWTSLGVVAAVTFLDMGEAGYGVLMAAAGGGTVIGILLSTKLVAQRHLAAPFATALALPGLAFIAIGIVAVPAAALVALVAWGVGMAIADVAAQALLTRVVPPAATGRVVGVVEAGKLLAEGLGALAAPLIAHELGIRATFVGIGVVLLGLLIVDFEGFRRVDRVAVGRVGLLELARRVPWCRSLRLEGLEALVAPMTVVPISAGEEVMVQDREGEHWYLVREGRLDVLVDGFHVGDLAPGDAFGERGLMRDAPRTASVIASTDGELLALARDDFLRAVTGVDIVGPGMSAPGRGESDRQLLRRQPILQRLTDAQIDELASSAEHRRVPAGAVIFAQGDDSADWLLIRSGEIDVQVDGAHRRMLAAGDALGEIGVLHEVARTASAFAVTEVELLVIDGPTLRGALDAEPART